MKRLIGGVALLCYIATIFGANYAIAHYGFVTVAPGLVAPAGVYFVGLALILRDVAQVTLGRWASIVAIIVGAALSYLVAPAFAIASGVAFGLSETTDFAIFTPLQRRGWTLALACSTAIAAVVDSAVFLYLAFGSFAFIEGQVVGKLTMTVLAVAASAALRPRIARVSA